LRKGGEVVCSNHLKTALQNAIELKGGVYPRNVAPIGFYLGNDLRDDLIMPDDFDSGWRRIEVSLLKVFYLFNYLTAKTRVLRQKRRGQKEEQPSGSVFDRDHLVRVSKRAGVSVGSLPERLQRVGPRLREKAEKDPRILTILETALTEPGIYRKVLSPDSIYPSHGSAKSQRALTRIGAITN
jgi:hypothetical protein